MNYVGYPLNRFLPDNSSEVMLKLLTKESTRFFLVSKKATAVVFKDPANYKLATFKSSDLYNAGIIPNLSADLDDEGNGEVVFFMGASPLSSNLMVENCYDDNSSAATFCVYVSNLDSERLKKLSSPPQNFDLLGLRDIGWGMDKSETAMLGFAWALSSVHERQRFDVRSGHKTKLVEGGRNRAFTKDGEKSVVYPRTDPVVIMVIRSPDEKNILLARSKRYKNRKGLYSCLAGFIEPGESAEEAAKREA
jgi:NAD+ diphosphatase